MRGIEKANWRRFWGATAGLGALGGVFFGNVGAGVAFKTTEKETARVARNEEGEAKEKNNGWFGRNGGILTAPRSEARLSVRELRPGDILAARWEDEERNGTPGFWNHLAIVGTDGSCVVEAQKSADGIVTAPINGFLARYSEIVVFRFFDSKTARRAAEIAESWVAVETVLMPPLRPEEKKKKRGEKEEQGKWEKRGEEERERSGPRYSWSASLTPILRSDAAAENCVSLVRRAFWKAAGVDYRWKTPDDLARWDKSGDFAKIGRF